jgi:hypothetical protein
VVKENPGIDLLSPKDGLFSGETSYNLGDRVEVAGRVWAVKYFVLTRPVPAKVELLAFEHSTGDFTRSMGSVNTDAEGYFKFTFPLTDPPFQVGSNSLKIVATPVDEAHYRPVSLDTVITVAFNGWLSVTLSTDKPIYAPDEIVTLSGDVTSSEHVPGSEDPVTKPAAGKVQIQWLFLNNRKEGTEVSTDGSGHFTYTFTPDSLATLFHQRFMLEGTYMVVATATAPEFSRSLPRSAFYSVQEDGAGCALQEIEALQVTGAVLVQNTRLESLFFASSIKTGDKFAQGSVVQTGPGERVAVRVPFQDGAEIVLGIEENTVVRFERFCRDTAGKAKLRVHLSNPGRLKVLVNNGTPGPLDYKIVTPTAVVNSAHTKYTVDVDAQGLTTVTGEEDEALVAPQNPDVTETAVGPGK